MSSSVAVDILKGMESFQLILLACKEYASSFNKLDVDGAEKLLHPISTAQNIMHQPFIFTPVIMHTVIS